MVSYPGFFPIVNNNNKDSNRFQIKMKNILDFFPIFFSTTTTTTLILMIIGLENFKVSAIKCYQCSTEKDEKNSDNCGAYRSFNYSQHIAVDCMGEEANTPGTFCFKSIQQGPRGFIWDGRWRSVIRRCAQVSERGISWSCDWGYYENGVYWEECYCAEDNCNDSVRIFQIYQFFYLFLSLLILSTIITKKIFFL